MQRISLGVILWCGLMGCKWTVGWQMVRHLPIFLGWIDIQIFLAVGICLWSSANLMVESFLLQIKQLIVPLCLLKVLTLPPSMLAFFQAFLLILFLCYFILTLKFCFSLQSLFGKEADKLEQANDDDKTCILCFIRSINLVQFALPV